jgi:undecaprenyl diphosphate synthase
MQSTCHNADKPHIAIIMDGNGRWAERRGLPRSAGHRAGAGAVRRIVEAAARAHVGVLTLYAFSADNWSRPTYEVATIMRLLEEHLASETARCVANGIRLRAVGRRDRLAARLVRALGRAEQATAGGAAMELRLAIDYSARDAIVHAAARCGAGGISASTFEERLAEVTHAGATHPVDLLIRTGGEQRLSDFLLWECAYAELLFTDRCWPDFDEADFAAALAQYERRDRRFGGLPRAAREGAIAAQCVRQ